MDKVKAQAGQVATKAQQGVAQGQTKLGDMQAKKQTDALLRDLGAAYYAAQSGSAAQDAVDTALAAVRAHAEANGPVDTAASAPATPGAATAEPGGNFTLDEL